MIEKLQFISLMLVNDLKAKHAERGERGATAVEYGLLVALIAAVIVATVVLIGQNINQAFVDVNSKI